MIEIKDFTEIFQPLNFSTHSRIADRSRDLRFAPTTYKLINNKEMSNFNHSTIIDFKKDIEYAGNSVVSKRVLEQKTGNITLFSFDKGQKLSEHSAPFDAMVQVVEGQVEITIDKKPYILKEGETIIMPANIPHALLAVEKFKMLLTMIKG